MATIAENKRYEARMKVAGYVRGPRLTAEASDALRELAHEHRLTPCEVVSRLLLGFPLDRPEPVGAERSELLRRIQHGGFQERERLSDSEMWYIRESTT